MISSRNMVLSRLFRSGNKRETQLEKELARLEEQTQSASSGYETQFLNRAGALCVDAGQPARALGYYGRAIDVYLETGRFSAAEVLCRRVLEITPQAVRARCTLAWLELGKGFATTAADEIREYVQAAERAGQEKFATKQLMMMAEAASDDSLREGIAHHLLRLDATEKAEQLFARLYQERNGLRAPPAPDQGSLWTKLLRAALMGPKELSEQKWGERDEDPDDLPSLMEE